MIVLDTNILSEALKPSPEEAVLHWLAEQNREVVFTTAITQAEILYGVEMLPAGKRRNRLHAAVERLFADEFPERIPEDRHQASARRASDLSVRRTDCVDMPVAECDDSHPEHQ
jgi:toxin FitB